MNIGFYDPISERWIKPRPEPEREIPPAVSLGEALLNSATAKAEQDRCERIWALLKQTAEGVNAPTANNSVARENCDQVVTLQWDDDLAIAIWESHWNRR